MTIDKEKLKALAEAARDYSGSDLIEHESRYNALACEVDPVTVLTLLAEIERLAADEQETTTLCSRLSDLLRDVALAVRGPEEPLKRHGFADLPSRVKAVVAERDQLKAENAQLKNHEIELKAENEVLRKQVADLSPFKNASPQDYRASNKCLACGDYHHGLGNLPCPRCTPVAQSAMAKEANHG
ncbi:hypothetical protein [Pseudomonas juntendi]|uniref:Uncharacterized protein n=1 Tax=Pseudomonas juntendi TaxID=2666183 RepID=A0A7W2M0E7_9PSED|nr:hypothetical protein [Pseudomonas juntendi]MBA6150186.1 hypothetical protein [Pseudomonas juntendi]MBH3372897.1 hypothetical protein [Pseudomonas juntendi]